VPAPNAHGHPAARARAPPPLDDHADRVDVVELAWLRDRDARPVRAEIRQHPLRDFLGQRFEQAMRVMREQVSQKIANPAVVDRIVEAVGAAGEEPGNADRDVDAHRLRTPASLVWTPMTVSPTKPSTTMTSIDSAARARAMEKPTASGNAAV
jgi:hypothetical protein